MKSKSADLIAIDGPAGVGKSTAAKRLAERLGYYFLSSGMIYRAMAWHLLEHGWSSTAALDPQELERGLAHLVVTVGAGGRILANGQDVTDALRTEAVSQAASLISTVPAVRDRSNQVQRETVGEIGRSRTYPGVVLEGRDIGTVVFPEAPHKFFLTANEAVRAQRRFAEQRNAQPGVTLNDIRKAMQERDTRDSERTVAPLVPAPDAIPVDTSDLTLDQVLATLLAHVQTR